MKRILLLISLPAIAIVGTLAMILLLDDSPLTPGAPVCGLSTSPGLSAALRTAPGEAKWSVYAFDGTATAPRVLIREQKFNDVPWRGVETGCDLDIRSLPASDSRGLDWRIGFIDADIEKIRGKAVNVRFFLKSKENAELGSGAVYTYDGRTVAGAQVAKITRDWTEYVVSHPVPEDADTFELWFRLTFDRPHVVPTRNVISLAAHIEEGDSTELTAKANDFEPASCPFQIGAGLETIKVNKPDRWFVYRYEGSGAPDVTIDSASASADQSGPSEWCTLNVTNAPTESGRGVDWRLGHIFEVSDLRGKTLTFSADMKADRPTKMTSARLYTYDGARVSETVLPGLTTEWETFELTVDIPADASTFQTWFRLAFDDGTVTPGETSIQFAPRIEVAR